LISAAQGPIRKGVLHREKTPFIWVPLPGGAKERSDVPSAGDNGLIPMPESSDLLLIADRVGKAGFPYALPPVKTYPDYQ
jgi:hypothetical protein